MPAPRFRSRTFRRIYTRTPGGKTIIHYKKHKPSKQRCSNCKTVLKGLKADLPYKIRKLTKSQKTVKRMFGNYLCSKCSRRKIINRIRKENE